MINVLSHKIAAGIKSKVPEHQASVAVLQYSISFILNIIFIISLSLGISLLTGQIANATIALVAFAALRQVSGGYHLHSGMMCIVVSTAGITLLSFADFNGTATFIFNAIAFIIALFFAPSRIEAQTRIPKKYFPILKLISLAMIAISFLVGSSVLASTFLVQALTLIRIRR
ncbi:accessory gene regulator ArgB-like protein [Paenibacillus mendelii]|uniref:Accessory gene regulator ArgB-like protein n=1 Tax=Paenibacillus mendelii TaxID=206163 RepID=A0ABV6J934_9BACL|nr:accessory gene regulator B family protein [Paenibacillus mendelii]MCQ6559742.1 accessory gene regulator B family protein [Paenibacillus mendelii]